ncbi:uncharacterized protein LOC135385814 [Ornithodoros turicata]|uniref:uncharacterized protein LOC135385814 n=1 Tax=Ornithodoros turicata TaxID=34597 RepID=UPI003138B43D
MLLGCYLVWIIGLLAEDAACLRLVETKVPSAVIQGEGMWLNCSYDLESDELYSVKWYKNDTEFYRYIPRDRPPAQNYDLPGVVVDMQRSFEGNVYVASVNLSTEGSYRCEASAEAPSFQTDVQEKEIKVFVVPKEQPVIYGTRHRYKEGDLVNVTCKAPFSLPGAKLTWLINDDEVPLNYVKDHDPEIDFQTLQSSSSSLTFVVQSKHLAGVMLKLKCVSVISEVLPISSDELIVGDTVPPVPYPETSRDSPTIEGGRPKYRIGDLVDLTCKSAKYDFAQELMWFINDKEVKQEYLVRKPRIPGQRAELGLRFRARHEDFEDERMHLRCTTTLSNVISVKNVETAIANDHHSSGLRATAGANTSGSMNLNSRRLLTEYIVLLVLLIIAL